MHVRRVLAVVLSGLAVLTGVATTAGAAPAATQPVSGKAGEVWDHYTVDSWGDPAAVASGQAILDATAEANTQALMGWGASDPEPASGTYDWSSLDYRVAQITARGGTPVMTLCCAPGWMRGGDTSTDWSGLTQAPYAANYADFAALAAAAAARYPQIKYFQVWNEMKGFWSPSLNRWNYEGYTQLYNLVYDAVKVARPDAKVGGPYVVINSYKGSQPKPSTLTGPWGTVDQRDLDAITYWLANRHGADFVTIDMSTRTRDAGVVADPQVMTGKVTATLGWLRQRTSLPIWFAEFGAPAATSDPSAVAGAEILGLSAADRSGAALTNFWGPEQQPNSACDRCLFSSTLAAGGGAVTPLGHLLQVWHGALEPKPYQRLTTVATGVYAVEGMTTATGSPAAWILVNTTAGAVTVNYLGKKRKLVGYAAVTSAG